ncbi:serine hydrolase domain-containing protein [Erythrobacter sp.]|uniref:serine hydrolase domain-containing protein n=1 Tax=Sphingomonadales TaxID=204457 RepID=UPI00326498A2
MRFLKSTAIALGSLVAIGGVGYAIYGNNYDLPSFEVETFEEQDLQSAMQFIVDESVKGGAPGALIHIRKGEADFTVTAGLANTQTGQEMPADAPLRIASVSKIYTAVVIHTLINQGRLDLDAKLVDLLPSSVLDSVPNASEASISQLLYHTSGIPDYYDVRSYLFEDWEQPISLERMLPHVRRMDATGAPGESYVYSNTGYLYLGAVAEAVTGQPLGDLIANSVSEPLGFDSTYYTVRQVSDEDIHGYGTYFQPWKDATIYWEHSGPDSGIMAPASEVAQLLKSLTFEDGALNTEIGSSMLEAMVEHTPRQAQGLGIETITSRTGEMMIGHTGSAFGYKTLAFAIPERDLVFVAHLNCECDGMANTLLVNIYRAIVATDGSTPQVPSD